jgi:CHAT domain-containing protein/Flp pilus assembly protein TadD
MSLSGAEDPSSTLKRYSQQRVDFSEIDKLSREAVTLINKTTLPEDGKIKALQKIGQALWDHLLSRPVKEKIKSAPSSNLALIIDEELISIPWEFLYDGDNFICLNFNLGRQVRTKSQRPDPQYRSFSHVHKMLILANPTDDLKCAYREGLNIKNQFMHKSSRIHVDFKSTKIDKLYVKKNLCDYDIVHFAGHCEFDPQRVNSSGWLLSDGRFSAHDILSMGQAASLPTLVFSNACNSAQEDVHGLVRDDYQRRNYSLASAFLFSGVRHYIGCIRKIEDAASLSFAAEFYHYLIAGHSVGESLRLSRVKLANQYGVASLHWSNYLLYGDPEFVLFKPKAKPVKSKNKLDIHLRNKILIWSLGFSLALIILTLAFLWLPTLNPNAYYLFYKAENAFAAGRNSEVIVLGENILSKDKNFTGIYQLLAKSYYRMGDKERALKYYYDYALLAEKRNNVKDLLTAYIEIGWFYHLEGDYAKAFDFYNKVINLSRKNNDKLNEAIGLRKLAVWYIDKKDYDSALSLLTKSSAMNMEKQFLKEYRYNLACDYFDIGLVFVNKEDFDTAAKFYAKSRAIFEKLQLKNELSDYYFNLGEICLFEKKYQKALDYYLAGFKIDKLQDNKVNLVSDYNMLGELYMEMDRLKEAESALKEAALLAEEINSQPELAAAYRNLGLLYKKAGKMNKAKDNLRKAQEIYSLIDLLSYQAVKKDILALDGSG